MFDFTTKFKKSKHGIDEALKELNETLLLSIGQVLQDKRQSFNSIIAVLLRNLLYEEKILHIDKELKLPKFQDKWLELDIHGEENEIVCYRDSELFKDTTENLCLNDWLKQKLVYIKRQTTMPKVIYDSSFEPLVEKIKNRDEKQFINTIFQQDEYILSGEKIVGYSVKSSATTDDINKIADILDKYGYDNITVGEYIKLLADKTGAHLDYEWPIGLMMIHNDQINYMLPIGLYISQILTDYLRREGLIKD